MKILAFICLALRTSVAWGRPPVVSTYKSPFGCAGAFVDFSGRFGDDVIAPADADAVTHVGANWNTCGNTVALHHREFDRYTLYCHFQTSKSGLAIKLKRGDVIGTLGDTGVPDNCRSISTCPIVHMESTTVPRGHPQSKSGETFDLLNSSVGCFDQQKIYPTDRS